MDRLVTVVVPVYNSEKTIERCIKSIFNQSYKNIELIIINDGSADNSLEVCQKLCYGKDKVMIISKENEGVSVSRNRGIEEAMGDYVVFVDSDDELDFRFIEKMHLKMNENPSGVVLCNILTKIDAGGEISLNSYCGTRVKAEDFVKLYKCRLLSSPCNKIYDLSVLKNNNIRFDVNLSDGEDLVFNLKYLSYKEELIVINEALYIYHLSSEQGLHLGVSEKRFKELDIMLKSLCNAADRFNIDENDARDMNILFCEDYLNTIRDYNMHNKGFLKKAGIMQRVIRGNAFRQTKKYIDLSAERKVYKAIIKSNNSLVIVLYFYIVKLKNKVYHARSFL